LGWKSLCAWLPRPCRHLWLSLSRCAEFGRPSFWRGLGALGEAMSAGLYLVVRSWSSQVPLICRTVFASLQRGNEEKGGFRCFCWSGSCSWVRSGTPRMQSPTYCRVPCGYMYATLSETVSTRISARCNSPAFPWWKRGG
jgi:hypothetical protein